nr:helix-turn-helix transcriptional regulator [Serratia proteamaculans]
MTVYIVTDNNFFFIGLKEKLTLEKVTLINPTETECMLKVAFEKKSIFIFFVSIFSMAMVSTIITEDLSGKIIIILTSRKENLKSSLFWPVFLGRSASIDDICTKIFSIKEQEVTQQNPHTPLLTVREKQILRHVFKGKSVNTISRLLGISRKTVYSHQHNALQKLGGKNLFEIWPFRMSIIALSGQCSDDENTCITPQTDG